MAIDNKRPEKAPPVHWAEWLQKTLAPHPNACSAGFSPGHQRIADAVIAHAGIAPGQRVLDVGTGTGLLAFTVASQFGTSVEVVGVDIDEECLEICRRRAGDENLGNLTFVLGDAHELPAAANSVDAVVCRSVLCHILEREPLFREWYRVLKPNGRFSFYEPIDRCETRFSDLVNLSPLGELASRLRAAEECFHHCPTSSLMNYDANDLKSLLEKVGFSHVECIVEERTRDYAMTARSAVDWWHLDVGGEATPGHPSPYSQLKNYLPAADLDRCVEFFANQVDGTTIRFQTKQLFTWGGK